MEAILLGLKLYIGYVLGSFIVGIAILSIIFGLLAILSFLGKIK